ncbi:MAG: ABC transporter permease [Rhodospirillales bacterium]|nr:ABC transporter permease [Rhodospirillales bacterium]
MRAGREAKSPPSPAQPHGAGRWPRRILVAYVALVLLFLIAPILAIVPLSFNGGSFLTYPLDGLSLRWYAEVLTTEKWLRALTNSVIIAVPATALATILGTLAAVGLSHSRLRGKAVITGLLISPMIVPVIITAVGMYFFFAPLGLVNSYSGLILAHAALGAPFVFITVSATLSTFDNSLIRAAASLGAPPLTAFFRVTMPLIAPGLISGGLFAFATSFDEVIVVLFIGGPGQRTLPREIFDGIREHVTPAITAVATLLILFATALMATMEALRRRNERLAGQRKEP